MAIAIQLVCDECGRRMPPRVFEDVPPLGLCAAERARAAAKGWRRYATAAGGSRDLCASCVAGQAARRGGAHPGSLRSPRARGDHHGADRGLDPD